MREYRHNGATYLFDEDAVPDGAVEVTAVKVAPAPSNKAARPSSNKSAK